MQRTDRRGRSWSTKAKLFVPVIVLFFAACENKGPEGGADPAGYDRERDRPAPPPASAVNDTVRLMDDPMVVALFDSLSASRAMVRRAHARAITHIMPKGPVDMNEAMGVACDRYVREHTAEFIGCFVGPDALTSSDLKAWAKVVASELMIEHEHDGSNGIQALTEQMRNHCSTCSAEERLLLTSFTADLQEALPADLKPR